MNWFKPWVYWSAMGVFILLGGFSICRYLTDLGHNHYYFVLAICGVCAVIAASFALHSKRYWKENDQ